MMLSAALISLWIIIIPRRARMAVYARTRVPSPRRAVAREFDDGITSHWFPVYNAPEINVRSVGPPVNTSPHDGLRALNLFIRQPSDTPTHWYSRYRSDTPFASLRTTQRIFIRSSRYILHRYRTGYHTQKLSSKLKFYLRERIFQ